MLSKTLFLITILFFQTANAKLVKIGFKQQEKKAALHTIQLLRDHELSRKDKNELKHLLRLTKNPKNTFHKYYNLLRELNGLKKNYPKTCERAAIKTLNKDRIQKRIENIIKFECENLTLKTFLYSKTKVTQKEVEKVIPILLTSQFKHKGYLSRVTRKIGRSKYSNLLENYIIQNQLKSFSRTVITNTPKTSLLESYLQTIGYHDQNRKSSYLRSLKSLYRNFQREMRRKHYKKAKAKAKEAINFYMVNSENFENEKAWNYFRLMGRSLAYNNYYDEAIEMFKLSSLIGNRSQYNESTFNIIWSYLTQDRYDKAYKFIFDERLETKLSQLDTRLKFWIGKVYLENGFKIRAKQIFKSLINPKNLEYYAIIAKKELSELDKAEGEKILASLYQSRTNAPDSVEFSSKEIESLRRYKIFREIGATSYAYNQLLTMTKAVDFIANPDALKPQADFYYSLIQFLNSEDDYLTSFKVLLSALNKEYFVLDENLLAMLFPQDYMKTIERHASKTNPILFLSLIRQESAFNPSAKSRVGARGLMQIMPRTARQFQKRLRAHWLNRPSVNLKIGIKYFQKLARKYKGNLIHTLAAYNAGEGRVKRWKKNIFKSEDPLVNIESIPFSETQNYVKLIYRNIFFYQYLNDSKKTLSDVDDSFNINHYAKSI